MPLARHWLLTFLVVLSGALALASFHPGALSAGRPARGELVQAGERTIALSGGAEITVPVGWVQRQNAGAPPSPILQTSAPDFRFTEFVRLESRVAPAILQIGISENPFLGEDARALDTRFVRPGALTEQLFYFFFPPPESCLAEGAAAYRREVARREAAQMEETKQEKDEERRASLSTGPPNASITHRCEFASALPDLYAEQLSAGVVFSRSSNVERVRGIVQEFRVPAMEQVEANGMTFYVFEAQGQRFVEQGDVDKYRLRDSYRGAKAHFFWAVGAASPFPFAEDATRKGVPLVQVAYATLSVSGDARNEFLSLLRRVRP